MHIKRGGGDASARLMQATMGELDWTAGQVSKCNQGCEHCRERISHRTRNRIKDNKRRLMDLQMILVVGEGNGDNKAG